MKILKEDPHRAVILGAGEGGTAILEMLLDEKLVSVVGIVDINPDAMGLNVARKHGVPVYNSVEQALQACAPCVAFNMTGNEMIEVVAAEIVGAGGIIGGMEARLMHNMITNLKEAKQELRYQASHDPLTGLYNRRYMIEQMHQGVSQALRYRHPYAIAMLDVDHFKQVNDQYSHAAGDLVLEHLAKLLKNSVRDADVPGRWGGEEFVVLMPHTDLHGARQAAQQWLAQLNNSDIRLNEQQSIHITFSAGVAALDMTAKSRDIDAAVEQLLHTADERMYAAKAGGRNRICATLQPDSAVESVE